MKTCKTCKHARPGYWFVFGPKGRWKYSMCKRPRGDEKISPVTGERETETESESQAYYYSIERMYNNKCGAEGKYWEQKIHWFYRAIL